MRYIIAIHMSAGGTGLQHIEEVRWRDPATNDKGQNTRAQMVAWIDNGGEARVESPQGGSVKVEVVRANPPYLKTAPNNVTSDNLLSLQRW